MLSSLPQKILGSIGHAATDTAKEGLIALMQRYDECSFVHGRHHPGQHHGRARTRMPWAATLRRPARRRTRRYQRVYPAPSESILLSDSEGADPPYRDSASPSS